MNSKTFIILIILVGLGTGGFLIFKNFNFPQNQELISLFQEQSAPSSPALGNLCSGEQECVSFCLNNRGRCEAYCKENYKNTLCLIIFPPEQTEKTFKKTTEEPKTEAKAAEKKQEILPVAPKSDCISNLSPVFTNHITDMSKVSYVVPPPTMGTGPNLKTHSYIGTNGANVPLYAPTAMTLKSGSHYVGGPYMFEFQASCEVAVRFGHVTNPIDSIKNLLPAEPKSDSRTQELNHVGFAAGELIGYTVGTPQASNWDFGVYNSAANNRYINDQNWNNSATYTTAVCPFNYFAPDLKVEYVAKFDSKILGNNPPHGESFCQ